LVECKVGWALPTPAFSINKITNYKVLDNFSTLLSEIDRETSNMGKIDIEWSI
jgi:hypothetical protein